MRNLSNDIRANRPVLIQPTIAKAFLERCADVKLPLGTKASDMSDMLAAIFGAKATLEKFPPFAIVPIKGVIGRNLPDLEAACGACDIEAVEEMLEDCERDPAISTIIFDVDSPGGTAVGVPELAKRIRECSKKTISFTSADCCSAAYWLASQSSEFYATPSSSVANVGCYIVFNDMSAAFANEGVTVDVIRSGKLKGAGTPGTALSKEQRDMLQAEVTEIANNFKADVKLVREFVQDADMDGQAFSGTKAAEKGFVTALVNGFDELMETLDAQVAAQIEADEANDDRANVGGNGDESGEYEDDGMSRMAAFRALKGIAGGIAALVAKAEKVPDEQEKDGAEPMPKKGKKSKKANGDEDDEDETPTDPITDEDEKDTEPKDEEDGEEKPDTEDDEKEPKAEDAPDEDKDKEKPESEDEDDQEPKSEDDEEESDGAKEKAEEESDTGDKAIETDEEQEKKGSRNRSRGIA